MGPSHYDSPLNSSESFGSTYTLITCLLASFCSLEVTTQFTFLSSSNFDLFQLSISLLSINWSMDHLYKNVALAFLHSFTKHLRAQINFLLRLSHQIMHFKITTQQSYRWAFFIVFENYFLKNHILQHCELATFFRIAGKVFYHGGKPFTIEWKHLPYRENFLPLEGNFLPLRENFLPLRENFLPLRETFYYWGKTF